MEETTTKIHDTNLEDIKDWKEKLDENMDLDSYNHYHFPPHNVCPQCGYCPHCGRGGGYPSYPYYYQYPYQLYPTVTYRVA